MSLWIHPPPGISCHHPFFKLSWVLTAKLKWKMASVATDPFKLSKISFEFRLQSTWKEVMLCLWSYEWIDDDDEDTLSFPQEHLCRSAHLLAEMEAKSTKNSIGAVVMLLKGINMFSRVCSQRRSDVKYGVNQYSRVKTTLQNNHYNLGKAGKHMTAITFLNLLVYLSLLNYSLILSFFPSQPVHYSCVTHSAPRLLIFCEQCVRSI